jgi:hypothetical protein
MKKNSKQFTARRIVFAGVVLLLFVVGFTAFRGGGNPKPTITVSLLSEIDMGTNRLATLVLSNSGPGTIAIDIWNTNLVDG